jgi:two-component system nitrogen regulation response regulator NtrX
VSKPIILIVDDEEGIRQTLSDILEDEGYCILTAKTGEEAVKIAKESQPDLVILDIWLPGIDGIQVLQEIKSIQPDIPTIMISGHANIELAVKATKLGAYDFFEKPLSLERVILISRRALERRKLEVENFVLRQDLTKKWQMIGESNEIKSLKEQINMAASSNSRVLICGESGTGKEVVARLLHEKSPRNGKPFVEVNCAAIPHDLIESELFGHEKGSFTGAFEQKKGKFELADSGTLFLDEIGDMSLQTQSKVLRVIETQEFQRVGGSKNLTVDVRIITATNKDLKEEAKKENFREDLYFRLNVIPLFIPPLRERKGDIPLLVKHFLELLAAEYGKPIKKISSETIKKLQSYEWPGNVREMKNTIERLVIMTPSDTINVQNLFLTEDHKASDYFQYKNLKNARDAFEKDYIIRKLQENDWNVSQTADVLDIERSNLHRKIKAYDIKTS